MVAKPNSKTIDTFIINGYLCNHETRLLQTNFVHFHTQNSSFEIQRIPRSLTVRNLLFSKDPSLKYFFYIIPIITTIAITTGCSKGPPMGEVSGTVTVNGTPAKTGSISFFPLDRKSVTSGAAIQDGKYMAKVPLGAVKVEIRVSKVIGRKRIYNTPNSPIQDILQEVLPPKYNDQTELELDVQAGKNQKDYHLKTS